jgi:hypothetical protein
MSIRVMTAVWDSGAYEGGTLLVLLAFADWSKDDGTKIFPKIEQIMVKARLSERGARDCIRRLEEDRAIILMVRADGTPGRSNEWRIDLDRLEEIAALPRKEMKSKRRHRIKEGGRNCPPTQEQPENGVSTAPPADQSVVMASDPDTSAPMDSVVVDGHPQEERGQFAALETTGAIHDNGGNQQHERGQIEAPTGAVCDKSPTPPYIDSTVIQPSLHPPSGARAKPHLEVKAEEIPPFLRRFSKDFEQFLAAYPKTGEGPEETHKAWAATKVLRPLDIGELLAAVKADVAARAAENAARPSNNQRQACHPSKWLREHRWEAHMPKRPPADAIQAARARNFVWGGHPAIEVLRAELGEGEFDTWFAPCVLKMMDGVPILKAPTRFIRDRLATKHMDRLERVFGAPVIVSLEEEEVAA